MSKLSHSASPPDLAPDLPGEAIAARGELLTDEEVSTVINELAASWGSRAPAGERRSERRIQCRFSALLVPVADSGQALDLAPWKVTIRDLSGSGIGIAHIEPLPHRLVLLASDTAAGEPIRLLVRLKWCRFKGADVYESGGQIVRIYQPGE